MVTKRIEITKVVKDFLSLQKSAVRDYHQTVRRGKPLQDGDSVLGLYHQWRLVQDQGIAYGGMRGGHAQQEDFLLYKNH